MEVNSDWITINFNAASCSSIQRGSVGIADPSILESLALRDNMAWAFSKSWWKVERDELVRDGRRMSRCSDTNEFVKKKGGKMAPFPLLVTRQQSICRADKHNQSEGREKRRIKTATYSLIIWWLHYAS
ncbi:conserved hypothetical protein [Ricinus communis]|uniref:Uncharacterized protein n=1 Tax=Ricinus communis TaxID=3988 RepID=B9SSL8_RICCO|nr:conserved hypothetical protein [Ricinus communis]